MMVKLFRSVRGLVEQELNLANRQNGAHFHSPHEGFGVILEEIAEAQDEMGEVIHHTDSLIRSIRQDNHAGRVANAKDIERHAMLAASEFIQVAAMARKLLDSERVKYGEQDN